MEADGSRPSSFVEESLESRDNPFLPGGDLSKEAEELLSHATIVRDKFYLQQLQNRDGSLPSHQHYQSPHHDATDGRAPGLEERIAPQVAVKAEAGAPPPSHPRENGKAGDGGTSPDGVRLEVGGSTSPTAADGSSRAVGSDSDQQPQAQDSKDKAKRRPKCCVLM